MGKLGGKEKWVIVKKKKNAKNHKKKIELQKGERGQIEKLPFHENERQRVKLERESSEKLRSLKFK